MVGSTKSHVYTMLLYLMLRTGVYATDICTNTFIKEPIHGCYCPADANTIQLFHVPHYICTHYCVSALQCSVLSYDVNEGLCLMHKEKCKQMVQDTEQVFSSVIFHWRSKQCISWLPNEGCVPDGARFVRMDNVNSIAVRLHYNNEILPGRFEKLKVKTVTLLNGAKDVRVYPDSTMEFLVVSGTCSVAWVPYIAGNQMHPKAVVGGQRANGQPLFVASLWTTSIYMKSEYEYGYYDPESQLGYASRGGWPASNSSVDIMVELWDIGQISIALYTPVQK